jgi:thioredoxin reductase (NADPH)
MAGKPVILVVDDNPDALAAAESDLRGRYDATHRIEPVRSGATALSTVEALRERGDRLALVLADQRMPRMDGVELLGRVRDVAPNARRVLLSLFDDVDSAIAAIQAGAADTYLVKPWDRAAERIFPDIDDLLELWRAEAPVNGEGLQVVGTTWSAPAHELRDFLGRNQVPYHWVDAASPRARRVLARARVDAGAAMPVVVFPDNSALSVPSLHDLATRIGLQTRAELPFYDLLIVGGGPAGLAAAVYGASEGLKTALIEREAPGGQAGTSSRIENYLGFPVGLSGSDLARRGVAQARRFGAEILTPQEVTRVELRDRYKVLSLADGSEIAAHALLIAAGVSYRRLDVPGAERLSGAGVYYGSAMTEAFGCVDCDVFVVGGANSAGQAAVYLANYARTVTILVRGESIADGMSQYLVDQIAQTPNIRVWTQAQVAEVHGATQLERVSVRRNGAVERLNARALFIFIGAQPRTEWLAGVVARDERGFILTGPDLLEHGVPPAGWNRDRPPLMLETSVPGLFAAGDVRHGSIKRVASSVGEGSIAVAFVHQYLAEE